MSKGRINWGCMDLRRYIDSIKAHFNYFMGKPIVSKDKTVNTYEMPYYAMEVDLTATGDFESIDEEVWSIGDKFIITPHGKLRIEDAHFVNNGNHVGIQFSVSGLLNIANFKCSTGVENAVEVYTFALVRQPHNVWLWVYAFDKYGTPIINFCGRDDLDGLANFIPLLKSKY